MTHLKILIAIFAGAFALQAQAVPVSYSDSQTVNGPINYPGLYTINFTIPTGTPLTDATLTTTSQGDWSYEGASQVLADSESMSVTLDGNLLVDDLFHLDANLDASSPAKNDNGSAIFQTVTVPQALLATLVGDGMLQLVYAPRFQVDFADSNSFITAAISYRYDDEQVSVPTPGALALLGLGIAGLGLRRRLRSRMA